MTDVNLIDIFIKKRRIKYLRKYIQKQIDFLKKIQKSYIQIGGAGESKDNKEENILDQSKREGEQIRIIGISSFFQDAPNIIRFKFVNWK